MQCHATSGIHVLRDVICRNMQRFFFYIFYIHLLALAEISHISTSSKSMFLNVTSVGHPGEYFDVL